MASLEDPSSDKMIEMEELNQDAIDLQKQQQEEGVKKELESLPERPEAEAFTTLNKDTPPLLEKEKEEDIEPERTTTNLSDGNRMEEEHEKDASAEATSMDVQTHEISPQAPVPPTRSGDIEKHDDNSNKENVNVLLSVSGEKVNAQVKGQQVQVSTDAPAQAFQLPGDWKELVDYLLPAAKKRRRKKSTQNPFTCVSGGVKRSFSSAAALQLHQVLHKDKLEIQPGESGNKANENTTTKDQTEPTVATDETTASEKKQMNTNAAGNPVANAGEVASSDAKDNSNTNSNTNHSNKPTQQLNLPEDLQQTAAGQWLELLAADVSGRLGAVRRSRQRIQRGAKEDMNIAKSQGAEKVETLVAAASGSMLLHMEEQLEKETEVLNKWMTWINEMADKLILSNSAQPYGPAMVAPLPQPN